MKKRFIALDKMTSHALRVFSVGSGRGIVSTYKVLIKSYKEFVNEVKQFSPPGKGQAYVVSFKKAMSQLVRPIEKKLRDYKTEASRHIHSNKILSNENRFFTSELPFDVEYNIKGSGILMDRGGLK